MIKFLVIVILVGAIILYDTEIKASLSNFVSIVKTIVDYVAHSRV